MHRKVEVTLQSIDLGGHLHTHHQVAKWAINIFTSTLHGGIIGGVHSVHRQLTASP